MSISIQTRHEQRLRVCNFSSIRAEPITSFTSHPIFQKGKTLSSFPKRPERFSDQLSLLTNRHHGLFPRDKPLKLTSHLPLVPKFRMSGANLQFSTCYDGVYRLLIASTARPHVISTTLTNTLRADEQTSLQRSEPGPLRVQTAACYNFKTSTKKTKTKPAEHKSHFTYLRCGVT